jgi:SAM-dependent methyltransferase
MSSTARIFDEIRRSEMNDWVGGADPEAVGEACSAILNHYLTINANSRVLDFGCGVGRVMLSVLKHKPEVGYLTGFDIMPQVIRFCDEHIASTFPRTKFELIQGNNDHYDQFIASAGASTPKSHALLLRDYASAFTDVYAFSVFTHVEMADFLSLLRLLSNLLAPGGTLLFTAFLLTPYSRHSIQQGTTMFPLSGATTEDQGNVLIGNASDRLGFIAFDLRLVQQMVFEAGLIITHMEHGSWADAQFSASLQDVIVCRRPIKQTGPVRQVETIARPRTS